MLTDFLIGMLIGGGGVIALAVGALCFGFLGWMSSGSH